MLVALQKSLTVHVDGCREALMNYVRTWLFVGMCFVTSICFVLQALILILLRYLQTSISLAIKKGDPTADSLAYILSICLPIDDMTEDKCARPGSASMAAASAAPSFASSNPAAMLPNSTSQALEEAAATLAAVGQPATVFPTSASQSNMFPADAGGMDGMGAMCRRVPAINNSAQPASVAPSNRSSVISMTPLASHQRAPNNTSSATHQLA